MPKNNNGRRAQCWRPNQNPDQRNLVDANFLDADELAHAAAVSKFDDAGDAGIEGEVFAYTDVFARIDAGAALTDQDGTAGDDFSTEALDTESLTI